MNRLAQEMMAALEGVRAWLPSSDFAVPPADVEETEDGFVVEIELPGVRKEDVAVEVTGERLSVRAEKKERERRGVLRRRTRTVGSYQYEVTLPAEIDPERAEASLSDGVLTLRLPKAGAEKSRRIPLK